jgi:hypothetical protein
LGRILITENFAHGFKSMTPAVKNAVFALDLKQTRRHLHQALVSVKKPSAQSEELLKVDMDVLASSGGQIANAGDRSNETRK